MIIPAICFIGGLAVMGRTKPKTVARKLLCLGPRSGLVYPVEDFPEIGVVVVRSPDGRAIAQFSRAAIREPGQRGLVYQHGQGDPIALGTIRADFGVPQTPVRAVPAAGDAPAMSPAAAALTPEQRQLYWSQLAYRAPELLSDDQKRIVEAMKGERHPNNPPQPAKPAVKPTPTAAKVGRSTP